MRTALITTTINEPVVLRLYHACDPDVRMFVAGDEKTPHNKCDLLVDDLGQQGQYYSPDDQRKLSYVCSDLIGFGTISRRNIALLEALKWGAEIIVSVDDDNIPLDLDYFERFRSALAPTPWHGLGAQGDGYWFDVGNYLIPKSSHRGFPIDYRPLVGFDPVVDRKIGVAAGICLGDPDISAVDRISQHPIVHQVSEVLRAGIIVDNKMHTVFNSQNTAFIRELAPCFLMCPQFGRHDDIFASLIAQRVMRERGLHVHFGQPFVWQQRNPHDLVKDLKAELFGMEHVVEFAEWLGNRHFVKESYGDGKPVAVTVLMMVRAIYEELHALSWMPPGVSELGKAWCDDLEKVL